MSSSIAPLTGLKLTISRQAIDYWRARQPSSFAAVAEFSDNAAAAGATKCWIKYRPAASRSSSACIQIRDNGPGLDVRGLKKMFKYGCSESDAGRMGQYGVGCKTGAMKLGSTMLVFSCPRRLPEWRVVAMLSGRTQKKDHDTEQIVVPIVTLRKNAESAEWKVASGLNHLKLIFAASRYKTLYELLSVFSHPFEWSSGVLVEISDLHDKLWAPGSDIVSVKPNKERKPEKRKWHHDVSLRAFLATVYARLPEEMLPRKVREATPMEIVLQGRKVVPKDWEQVLAHVEKRELVLSGEALAPMRRVLKKTTGKETATVLLGFTEPLDQRPGTVSKCKHVSNHNVQGLCVGATSGSHCRMIGASSKKLFDSLATFLGDQGFHSVMEPAARQKRGAGVVCLLALPKDDGHQETGLQAETHKVGFTDASGIFSQVRQLAAAMVKTYASSTVDAREKRLRAEKAAKSLARRQEAARLKKLAEKKKAEEAKKRAEKIAASRKQEVLRRKSRAAQGLREGQHLEVTWDDEEWFLCVLRKSVATDGRWQVEAATPRKDFAKPCRFDPLKDVWRLPVRSKKGEKKKKKNRKKPPKRSAAKKKAKAAPKQKRHQFSRGDKVEALLRSGTFSGWNKGTVKTAHKDGTYLILFICGIRKDRVRGKDVRIYEELEEESEEDESDDDASEQSEEEDSESESEGSDEGSDEEEEEENESEEEESESGSEGNQGSDEEEEEESEGDSGEGRVEPRHGAKRKRAADEGDTAGSGAANHRTTATLDVTREQLVLLAGLLNHQTAPLHSISFVRPTNSRGVQEGDAVTVLIRGREWIDGTVMKVAPARIKIRLPTGFDGEPEPVEHVATRDLKTKVRLSGTKQGPRRAYFYSAAAEAAMSTIAKSTSSTDPVIRPFEPSPGDHLLVKNLTRVLAPNGVIKGNVVLLHEAPPVRVVAVDAHDARVGLRGQSMLVATATIEAHALVGVYTGRFWREDEYVRHRATSPVAHMQHERYAYRFEFDEAMWVIDAYPGGDAAEELYGNELLAANDVGWKGASARRRKKRGKGEKPWAVKRGGDTNAAFRCILVRGVPMIVIQALGARIKKNDEIVVDWGYEHMRRVRSTEWLLGAAARANDPSLADVKKQLDAAVRSIPCLVE